MAAWESGDAYEHVIIDKDTKAIVGACGFYRVNKIDFDCNLGYWVRESHLGQGAALEAVRQIRNFAFKETGLVGLEIVVAQTNLASRLVAEKARPIVDRSTTGYNPNARRFLRRSHVCIDQSRSKPISRRL